MQGDKKTYVIMNDKEINYDGDDVTKNNSSVSYCRYCGSKILSGSAFCSSCGKPLGDVDAQDISVISPATQIHSQQSAPQAVYVVPQQPPQTNQTTVVVNEHKSNGIGTAGFIFALLGILLSWIPVLDFIIWILGLIFSIIGLFKSPRGLAITGFILSIIDIIIIIAIFGNIAALLSNL